MPRNRAADARAKGLRTICLHVLPETVVRIGDVQEYLRARGEPSSQAAAVDWLAARCAKKIPKIPPERVDRD